MDKEVKSGRTETTLPLPVFVINLIGFAALLVYPRAPSPAQWDNWVNFHFALVGAIFLLSAPTIIFNWPLHQKCSISIRASSKLDFFGRMRVYEVCCGRPSVGRIKVVEKRGGIARWKYFCRYCDPEKPYFLEMLKYRYAKVLTRSTKKFRLVEKDRNGEEENDTDDDIETPDARG